MSHVDPLRKEYPELTTLLADPPELVGQRVRFLVIVVNQIGEIERARARVWTDRNIEATRNMDKEASRKAAASLVGELVRAVAAGDIESIPRLMKEEEH